MSKTRNAEIAEEAVGETMPEQTPAAEAMEQLIYLGPNKIGLINATVFVGGLTPRAEELIGKVPGADLLFVQIPDAAQAMTELRDERSALSMIYEQVRKADI